MKVVLAPNAFKGSMSAAAVARAMARGVLDAVPGAEVVQVPVADGGDGLVNVALEALGGKEVRLSVADPLGRPRESVFCFLPEKRLAAVEMALASGLVLLEEKERNPLYTTTLGTGELIRAALDLGVRHLYVGLGGSATNDGGLGVARALGARFFDRQGRELEPVGGSLARLARIDLSGLDPRLADCRILAACDVDNPLYGPRGAARIYGPQKGADPAQVEELDHGLRILAERIQDDLGLDVADLPGAGAAGGLGAGMVAFLGARLCPGIDLVMDLVGLKEKMQGADLVLTGEGRLDGQTTAGKAPVGVARLARAADIPCFALCGAVEGQSSALHELGLDAIFSICPGPMRLEAAMREGPLLMERLSREVMRVFWAGFGHRSDG